MASPRSGDRPTAGSRTPCLKPVKPIPGSLHARDHLLQRQATSGLLVAAGLLQIGYTLCAVGPSLGKETSCTELRPHRLEDLRRSGLADTKIEALGFYSATAGQAREILGLEAGPELVPAFLYKLGLSPTRGRHMVGRLQILKLRLAREGPSSLQMSASGCPSLSKSPGIRARGSPPC